MKFNSNLYQTTLELASRFPKGSATAQKMIFRLYRSNPSWDPWLLDDEGIYRLFYLQGSRQADTWWTEGEIYSATSTDLKHWQDTGVALAASDQNPWEAGRMLAGCALKENGTYYLFYSAAGPGEEFLNEGIGLATSTDGLHWQRHSPTELIKPPVLCPWYTRFKRTMGDHEYDYLQWRDPYVVRDVETGRYYMYICAAAKAASTSSIYRGCVGLAIADKITGPYELQPPVALPFVPDTHESPFYEMERPQIIYKQGCYHLFFSCWATSLNPKWLPTVDQRQITDSTLYWYVSDHPTGPFEPSSSTPVVTGSNHSGIYGTNFFSAPDRPDEFIAYGWYLRRLTLAILPLIKVVWNSDAIQIVNLSNFN